MIKHLAETLVPFASDGFHTSPLHPLPGEGITVCCRLYGTTETPMLTLRTAQEERCIAGTTEDGRTYAFTLDAMDAPQSVSYQIATPSEATPWFSLEVTTLEQIAQPLGILRDASGVQIVVAQDVTLQIAVGDALHLTLCQHAPQGEPCSAVVLPLPEGFTLETGKDAIWELKRLSETVVACTGFTLRRDVHNRVTQVRMHLRMSAQHVLGTGERFDAVDQIGLGTNGRVVEKFTHQGNQTYLPIPFWMTEQGYGWYRQSAIPAEMSFGTDAWISQETQGETLTRDVLYFGTPGAILTRYIGATGQPVLPPEWAVGVWISGNGWKNDAEVDAQLDALKRFGYPATVMVLEQWSDERTFYLWHPQNWRDPAALVQRVRDAGLHLVLWQIPVVKHEWDGDPGVALAEDTQEALAKGYVVCRTDGEPYRLTERWFHHSYLPDFTNPAAVRWWFDKRKPLLQMGVEGFKTDGGEFLFDRDTQLANGDSGLAAHNLYPAQYIGAYHDFLRENHVDGVLFSRAGYVGAQTQPIHWAGDQASEWSELQSQLNAGISAGLSGVLYWSFDIGGFAGPIPSAELYLRATAMGCFCPVMQWHSEPRGGQFSGGLGEAYNNDRSPWNLAEQWHDERVLTIGCAYATLREQLRPYLWAEAQYSAQSGRPMMAHLCLDHPNDPQAWAVADEYMLGRCLLVAPITHEGEDTRTVYLPNGTWTNYFTGETTQGPCELRVTCPLERIPVYRKEEPACTM